MTTDNLNFATENENTFHSENAVNEQEKKDKKEKTKKNAATAAKFAGAAGLGVAGTMAAQAMTKEPDVDTVIMAGAATHHATVTAAEETETEDTVTEEVTLSQYIEETNGTDGNLGHIDLVEEHHNIMADFDGPAPFSSDVSIDPIADESTNMFADIDSNIDMNNPVIDDTLLNDDISNDLGSVDNHIAEDFNTDLMDDILA